MPRISRRALMLGPAGAVFASTFAATAHGSGPQRGNLEPSQQLQKLIGAHEATYAAFGQAIRDPRGLGQRASRAEEKALLAICAYPAISEGDRHAKATYLLKVESRGELDLAEHVQALLRSTMWQA